MKYIVVEQNQKKERKVYPMKFTKFIPLALAFTFATGSVFAATTTSRNAEFQIEVPPLFNITEYVAPINQPGSVTLGEDLNSLEWTDTLGATYQVATNNPSQVFYVHAKTPDGSNAFSDDCSKIVFCNTASGQIPDTTAIASAKTSTDASTNPNCFAAAFPAVVPAKVAGSDLANPATTEGKLTFTASGSGTWRIPLAVTPNALPNTFSPADAAGLYKATIYITDQATITP